MDILATVSLPSDQVMGWVTTAASTTTYYGRLAATEMKSHDVPAKILKFPPQQRLSVHRGSRRLVDLSVWREADSTHCLLAFWRRRQIQHNCIELFDDTSYMNQ